MALEESELRLSYAMIGILAVSTSGDGLFRNKSAVREPETVVADDVSMSCI
jgi:hypothetical protein